MKDKYIRFKIDSHEDREKMLVALANSGYKVWVTVETHLLSTDFYVCVVTP